MSKYYKSGNEVYMVASVTEWKGLSTTVLRAAKTSRTDYSPLSLETEFTGSLGERFETATVDEWITGLAIAEKRQAELDKVAAKKAGGERYGVAATRHKLSYYGGSHSPIEPDMIVRCTKTRWVGLLGSYKRTVNYGSPGEMLRESGYGSQSSSIYLDANSLEHLAKMADGRLVVDFVKEAKKAERGSK